MGLPLRMSNLHAPTVPSGSRSATTANGDGPSGQLTFARLQQKKDEVEAELKVLGGVLDSHGVDMNTPLVTPDGFPRADVDVAQIRTTRRRIIELRNDYKDLMKAIDVFLQDHFTAVHDPDGPPAPISDTQAHATSVPVSEVVDAPFAKVNTVATSSPAERAGLKSGDEICVFGYVDGSNHDNLKKVAECVQGNEGGQITIKLLRPMSGGQRQELRLTLIPTRDWGGRGMLGCHILPM